MFNAPIVFFCQNNQWAISEPLEKQSRIPLYQRARGFGFPGVRVDGNDVLACYAVTKKAMQAAREGQGPTLIEAFTYRMGAHTTTDDPTRYRLASELEVWKLRDPIERVRAYLVRNGLAGPEFFAEVDAEAKQVGARVREACRTMPDPPPLTLFDHVYAEPTAILTEQREQYASYLESFEGQERGGGAMTRLTLSRGLNEGLRKALENDPKVLIMGEDVGKLGGVFRVTDGLQKDFGEARVIDTPLAESGIVGTAIGLALRGYRPVCEIQFDGFVFPAFDQIVSQLAKMRYRSRGQVALPVVIRIPFGGGIGAVEHHSESPEALFAHIPGLRVVACSDAADAFTMIQQSVSCDDPVIFFEPKRRYWDKAEVEVADGVANALPFDRARVVVEGTDVTLLAYGPMVRTALESAAAAREDGRSIEVIDLRSLSPLDIDTITASVRKTGRCVVAHEAPVFAGLGAEIAARVTERCFYHLEAPVLRVGGFAIPYPPSRLEDHYLPDLDRILDAVDRTFGY